MMRGDGFGKHIGGRASGLVDHREIHAVALDELVLRQAGLAQEPLKRLWRRADLGPFGLFADRLGRFSGKP